MKKSIYLLLVLGAFVFTACKDTPKSQKVVLVQGNFKYDKAKSTLTTSSKGKDLIIPIDSLLSSTILSRDTLNGTLQISMLLKDNGTLVPACGDNGQNCRRFDSNFTLASINPPPCWQGGGQCSGLSVLHFALDPNPDALLPAFQHEFENSPTGLNRQ